MRLDCLGVNVPGLQHFTGHELNFLLNTQNSFYFFKIYTISVGQDASVK